MEEKKFVEMKVIGIALDPTNNTPIVVLRDQDNKIILPIWIGIMEASAIAAAMEGVAFSRPMTHDLLKIVIEQLGGKVIKIEVIDLKDNVFYALVSIETDKEPIIIDARPSDAIALALRTKAQIFVASHVLEEASHIDSASKVDEETVFDYGKDKDKLKEILEKMKPEDFGKFKA
ncbi:MAG: bifunctional nuclease family protein [Deltaproteobacteria bacterium]|nr:bifunctional nuclease family protein [Deltaproteobacteria bacterium]